MLAAKEKTLNSSSSLNLNQTPRLPVRQPAATETKNQNRFTAINRISNYDFGTQKFKTGYDENRTRNSEKSPIGTSENFHCVILVLNQRSSRKTTGENVVQLRRLHLMERSAYFVPDLVDPRGGLARPPQDKMGFEEYWEWWKKRHPHMTQAELDKWKSVLAGGCVGVTKINLGFERMRDLLKQCYNTPQEAKKALDKLSCGKNEKAQVFSIHFWYDGKALPKHPDGTVDLDDWYNNGDPFGRPTGDWDNNPRTPDEGPGVNYDFGFRCPTGTILHADMYHNPDEDGDGKGDFFPNSPIREATLYGSSYQEWRNSYADFDTEVWCVACQKESAKCRSPKP